MARATFKIEGMTCDHCVHAVEGALCSVTGVRKAQVDLEQGRATVLYEGTLDLTTVLRAVEAEGYRATPLL
jgi:copper chaperone